MGYIYHENSINTVEERKLPPPYGINSGSCRISKELPTLGNSDIAVLNRRMRSRMYGGVGGVSSTLPTRFFCSRCQIPGNDVDNHQSGDCYSKW